MRRGRTVPAGVVTETRFQGATAPLRGVIGRLTRIRAHHLVQLAIPPVVFEGLHGHVRVTPTGRPGRSCGRGTPRTRRLAAQHYARRVYVDGAAPGQQVALLQLDPAHGLLTGRSGCLKGEADPGVPGQPAVDGLFVGGHHLLGGPLGGLPVGGQEAERVSTECILSNHLVRSRAPTGGRRFSSRRSSKTCPPRCPRRRSGRSPPRTCSEGCTPSSTM